MQRLILLIYSFRKKIVYEIEVITKSDLSKKFFPKVCLPGIGWSQNFPLKASENLGFSDDFR